MKRNIVTYICMHAHNQKMKNEHQKNVCVIYPTLMSAHHFSLNTCTGVFVCNKLVYSRLKIHSLNSPLFWWMCANWISLWQTILVFIPWNEIQRTEMSWMALSEFANIYTVSVVVLLPLLLLMMVMTFSVWRHHCFHFPQIHNENAVNVRWLLL